VHSLVARRRKEWPSFEVPQVRGEITVADVTALPPGPERDAMLELWCASVWDAYRASRDQVIELVGAELG
jgi:hypothetical protein